jgi:hypothetical protein
MIELKGIHKAFNTGRENEFHALNGIDLHLPTQRVTAFRFADRAARARQRCCRSSAASHGRPAAAFASANATSRGCPSVS